MAARIDANREWRLLSWWLATFHPDADTWLNIRVGPTNSLPNVLVMDTIAANASRLRNRWADAIFVEHGRPNIIEAKLEPDPGVFSQLIHYARKFRADPAWSAYAGAPLNLIAVVGRNDPSVEQEAAFYGVTWVVYQPPWLDLQFTYSGGNDATDLADPLPVGWAARLGAILSPPY